jgi:hypothetical protein
MSHSVLKKILNYRLFLKNTIKTKNFKINNKLILICFLHSLTNKAFLLSKLFFLKKHNNSWFNFKINSNIKLIKNKLCIFFFDSLIEILYFIFLTKSLTLIPYIFFPLKILSGNSQLELPLNIFNLISINVLKTSFNIFLFWKNLFISLYLIIFNLLKKKNAYINSIK